jgi:murein DD-endopeptidase MepM/ murein hydrolase activator NlpD
MPNYTLAQLRAMQAERRYWDKRDPANADFVAQVDQGYRDLFAEPAALVPTPEQEEQSRRLEEDLRRRITQSEYWNPRHADYRRLHADVAEGYARLHPAAAPASAGAEPEPTSSPAPVNLLELTRQMAEAPAPLPLAPAQNAMTATQDDDLPPPPPPSPKPIPANPPTERPVPEMTNPVPGAPIRGQDPAGAGHFGAGRGTRTHSGVDIVAPPGTPIIAPVSGTVVRTNVEPYSDPKHRGRYIGVDIETDDGHIVRLLYVSPADGLKSGVRVEKGKTQIGQAQDLHQSHDKRMTNHIHLEVHRPAERPEGRGRPSRNYIDPSPYVRDR